jgi:acetamidase/formamidase
MCAGRGRRRPVCYATDVQFTDKHLTAHTVHHVWDNSLPPLLEVAPGETFSVTTRDASDRQLEPGTSAAKLRKIDLGGFWPLTGPVAVRGARPGDAVEVQIVALRPGSWGWTAIIPERGLLRDEIRGPYLHHWELKQDCPFAVLRRGVHVPLAPFLGVIGCAPAGGGTSSPLPPRAVGGKLDMPQLVAGASLTLPVQVEGALLSFGHGRAAQGDGEVCGSGIECEMTAILRVQLHPGRAPTEPFAEAPDAAVPAPGLRRLATGNASDLLEAARRATRNMIAWLTAEHRMSREMAYVLCSVAAEMRVAQAVNTPHWTVTLSLPLGIFE